MNALVTAIADLIKTFCSGIVSLFTVPAQTLQSSFGHLVWMIPFCLVSAFLIFKFFVSIRKKGASPKFLGDSKKEDRE